MFGQDGTALSREDVFELLVQREGARGRSELIVHRDDDGRPRPARKVVHRGGVVKKSLIPLVSAMLQSVEAEGTREKHAGWLLRASGAIAGVVAQALELRHDEGSWIPDYAVITKPFSIVLLEVKALEWFKACECESMRKHFAHARDHGLSPVLWTDEWLGRNKLISNLCYLHKYRDHFVESNVAEAVIELLNGRGEIPIADFVALNEPRILHSVYALLAQGQIHMDLTRSLSDGVLRSKPLDNGDMIHGKDQLFAGPDV